MSSTAEPTPSAPRPHQDNGGHDAIPSAITESASSKPLTTKSNNDMRKSRSGSAPPEESSTARAARQSQFDDSLVTSTVTSAASSVEPAGDQTDVLPASGSGAASAAGRKLATAKGKNSSSNSTAAGEKTARRRSTRTTAKDKQREAASDSGLNNEDEDDMALLPHTTTLLFTTHPPSQLTIYQAPTLPITLQSLIEVPKFRILDMNELPMGRLRIQPNSGQQNDFSDEFYLKKHNHGEMLERKGRKQERDRLIVERNKIKMKIEQLKLEVASASFYANASPIKGISNTSTAINTNTASSTNTTSNTTTNNQQSRQSTPTVSTSTATTFSERMKESERNKRRQLQQAEETLRRYDELLQPREPYVTLSAATAASTSHATGKNTNKDATQLNGPNAPRTWLTGGKGIPPPPEGISPSDFLNAPRGASIANLQQQVQAQSTPHQRAGASAGAGRGSAIVAQRRLAQAGSGHHASPPSASPGAGSPGSSGAAGRVTRSRSSSPAVYGSLISFPPVSTSQYAPIASSSTSTTSAQPLTSTSAGAGGTSSNNNIPQRFIPILPRPSTSGAFMPSERRDASSSSKSTTSISATGPSSLTLKIRQGGNSRDITYQPEASTSQAGAGTSPDGALAARRRTRALQPIDIGLSRDDVYYPTYNPLKRSAGGDAGQVGVGTDMWSAPLGTGQIRPRKRRRRRRNRLGDYNNGGLKGDSSEDDDDTGAREAEREMEASNEFLEDQMQDEQSYILNIQSSYASAFDHTLPLGTPDDPDDADSETPRTARAASRRASMPVLARANSTTKKAAASPIIGPDGLPIKRRPGRPRKYPLQPPATATISSTSARAALEDATDFSDGAMRPPPPIPPVLPSIHIERASSASVSTDEPSRRVARQSSTRASTPASNTFKHQHHQRIPRQLFHRPDKPVEALLERSRFLTPDGRRGSPLPGKPVISGGTGINLAKLAAKQQLTTLEKAALTFESEGDLSSLPSETDEAGETSEFHDSESRFKSERALWRLETADTVAPAFLGSKGGASHGSTPLVASVLQEDVEDPAANGQLATLLDPTRADRPRRGRPPRTASSTPEPGISSNASNDYGKIATQVTVGGLKTRQRPRLDDYPVNDLNEISEIDMSTLRDSYQHVAARKKDMMGAKFLEMPIGDWQVYTPESDIRHT